MNDQPRDADDPIQPDPQPHAGGSPDSGEGAPVVHAPEAAKVEAPTVAPPT